MYYVDELPGEFFYQGDVFQDLHITTIPQTLLVARDNGPASELSEGPTTLRLANTQADCFFLGYEHITVKAVRTSVIVVSQTCDIQNREFIIIAPIFPLSRIESEKKKRSLREGKVLYRFHLPAKPDVFEESYAELTILNSIKRESLPAPRRVLSLTDFYRGHFIDRLNRFFCRPFMP